ncbi:MAG: serpin family protein [bacterium]|nr:MAG: serpin family protein [bacterium]
MTYFIQKHFIFIAFALMAGACTRITDPIPFSQRRQLNTEETKLVSSDNRFGIKIFKELSQSSPDSNVFISPLSISMALGMTLNGAAGETRLAMEKTLELYGLTQQEINQSYLSLITLLSQLDPKVAFKIANSIWYRDDLSFKQEFIDINKYYFNARVESLNFSDPGSILKINQWVFDQTHGKIKKMINQIDPNDIMFLINAIYFKGIWTYQFDPQLTQEDQFYHPAGHTITCQLMHQERNFFYLEDNDIQAVELPYGNGDFRMAIILPKKEVSLQNLISNITHEQLINWLGSFQTCQGVLEFPKFKFAYKKKLNDILGKLGMGVAFDPINANFSNLYEGLGNAFISLVMHKSFIQVDEEGTEAAAATSVTITLTSAGSDKFIMRVVRPFLFVLYDKPSQTVLFVGKITEPQWEN